MRTHRGTLASVWEPDNRMSYAAERNWIRDENDVHWRLAPTRATCSTNTTGRLTLADEQLSSVLAPEHYGEAGASSLRHDSDLLARNPSTNVLVLGCAYAPSSSPTSTLQVSLRIGVPAGQPSNPGPTGACAAQRALLLLIDDQALPAAMTEEWYHGEGGPTDAPIEHRT